MPRPKGAKNKPNPLRTLRKAIAVLQSASPKEAYKKLYPNASDKTAAMNGASLLTPDVFEEIRKLMDIEGVAKANRDILEKVLFMVISRWMKGVEKTSDMITAIRELTRLVPEFKDKLQVEDITNASEEELDRRIRSFGYDPNRLAPNPN